MDVVNLTPKGVSDKKVMDVAKSIAKGNTIDSFFKPKNQAKPMETPKKKVKKAVLLNTIMAAFIQMKWRSGVSQITLKNYLMANYQEELGVDSKSSSSVSSFSRRVSRELKKGVDNGIFEKHARLYKMNKSIRKSICNSVKKLSTPSRKGTKPESSKKVKILSEEEKARLRVRVEKEKLVKETTRMEKYLLQLKGLALKPREMVISNASYHFSVGELAKEKFIFDFDEMDDIDEDQEKRLNFKLNKKQMAKAILVAEFCNYFSSPRCLKLSKFSLNMLIRSLLDNKINNLIRETHLALLDMILSPTNLLFLMKNNQYKKNDEFMCRYEKLLILDLYSILNITTWQEILRRFLIFSVEFNVSKADRQEQKEMEDIISLLAEMDYNFLRITQKLTILEKLVEEGNHTVFVREHLQQNINNVSQLSKEISSQNKDDNKRKKELILCIKEELENNGFSVPGKRKAKGNTVVAKKQKLDDTNKENPLKDNNTQLEKKEVSLKVVIKESSLEEINLESDIFTQKLPGGSKAKIGGWQAEIRELKPKGEDRLKKLHSLRFWNTIRQKPLGTDSFKNEYYMLKSDLCNLYIYGNNLDLGKNRELLVKRERGILEEKLQSFDTQANTLRNPVEVLDFTNLPPPPPPKHQVLENVKKTSKPRLSIAEREAIAKARKEKNWAFIDTKLELKQVVESLNKYNREEKELKTNLESLSANVLSFFPDLTSDEDTSDSGSRTSVDISAEEGNILDKEERRSPTRLTRRSARKALSHLKEPSTDTRGQELARLLSLKKMLLFHQQEGSYEKYMNRMTTGISLTGISVLDFGLDLMKHQLLHAIRENIQDSKVLEGDVEYEFTRLRISRSLFGGEHSDYSLNWIICELVAICQLLDRNGGYLEESNLAQMLLEDSMLEFYQENVLRVRTDLNCNEEEKSYLLGRVDDFCNFEDEKKPTKRLTRRMVLIESDSEAGSTSNREFSMMKVIAEIEELYDIAPLEDDGNHDREQSSSTLSEQCVRSLIDLLLILENLACSVCNIKHLSSENYFDQDGSSDEEEFEEEDETQPKKTKAKNKEIILSEVVRKYLKEYEETSSEVRFEALVLGDDIYDVAGFDHSAFTSVRQSSNIDTSFYKVSLRSSDVDKINLISLVPRLTDLSQKTITEEDMLEGMTLAEEEKKSGKILTSIVRKQFEKIQSYYRRIWDYSVKRELWLESLKNLFKVRSVSAAAVVVAQLSSAIYNNKTKQVYVRKLPKKSIVPLIDASMN